MLLTPAPKDSVDLIKKVLGESYLPFNVFNLTVADDMHGECVVKIQLHNGQTRLIEGVGGGLVSGIFSAFKANYAEEYPSLKSISLSDFSVGINKKRGVKDSTDVECTVHLEICNSEAKRFFFEDSSKSLTCCSARSVASAVEFFVNSEMAFITLYKAWEDAVERNRHDLETRYINELALVVSNTSYTAAIEELRKEIDL